MIRLILAEDQTMLREALAALLALNDDLQVVGQAADGEEAVQLVVREHPDLCLMDVEMPRLNGLDAAWQIKQLAPQCKIIILTTFGRPGFLQKAMKAGVEGYLLKDAPVTELAKAIRLVAEGGRVVSPELAWQVWQTENPLTEREQAVLKLAAAGHSAAKIAALLFLSEGTVRNYLSAVIQKLGVANRLEAVREAEAKGWLE